MHFSGVPGTNTYGLSTPTSLFSLATPPQSSGKSSSSAAQKSQQHEQIEMGRVLEGGQVIDFSSVKASSHAEHALAQARHHLLQKSPSPTWDGRTILGINDDVIAEVGHDLGTFCTSAQVQEVAAYLRSQAPAGLFEPLPKHLQPQTDNAPSLDSSLVSSNDSAETLKYREIMAQAYFESGEVTSAFAKTFYMGTMLLDEPAREAIWAVYVWCRRTDEIVDAPRDDGDDMLEDLSSWELRLERLWQYGQVQDVFDLCLLDLRIQYPTLDITPFMDMIRGMLMDVPELGVDRYEAFDELHLYCYRVAGTVGLMSLPVFGCADGFNDEVAREPALSLGVAFQLTNILRDVGEDASERGRVYLPQEDLRRFGVTEEQIFAQKVDENYINMMKFQIARARMYYERARRGVFMLAPESRLPVQSSLDAYGRILDKIEANGYDSLTKRAYVDKWEKLSIIPFSWYRTQDISQWLPLPGDRPVQLDQV
jgi:phytoene synthase